ncbi:MAG: hypothetical protein QM703_15895 [Gemmatales bacterium]
MLLSRYVYTLALSAMAAGISFADFYAPTAWTRPTATSTVATFQGWETFSSVTGPNAPQIVPGPAFGGAGNWAPFNLGGTANAFDSSAPGNGAFVTGGGNIYSFAAPVTPRVIVPNNLDLTAGTNNSGWTTLIFQVRTQGSVLDITTGRLNGTILPVSSEIIYDQVIPGGFGGNVRDYWLQFQVAGNADSYQFDISGPDSSVSFDRMAVDTIWNSSAQNQSQAFLEATPLSAVPEPSTWALCGITLLIGSAVKYRQYRRSRLAL